MTEREGLFEVQGRMLIASLRRAGMDDPTIRRMCRQGSWEWLLDLQLNDADRQGLLGFLELSAVLRSLIAAAAVQVLTRRP